MDPGVLFGDGIFETLRAYEGRPFRLAEHLERLREAAAALDLPVEARLAEWTRETLERSGLREAHLRITLMRGGTVILSALPLRLPTAELYERGARAIRLWTRDPEELPNPEWKSTSYQRSLLARRECTRRGAYEGLFTDAAGNVLEGASSNVFVVRRDELFTPAQGCLQGITRAEVLRLAKEYGFKIHETKLSLEDLLAADEVFVTSSIAELMPIVELNANPFGSPAETWVRIGTGAPGPITRTLHQKYREACAR